MGHVCFIKVQHLKVIGCCYCVVNCSYLVKYSLVIKVYQKTEQNICMLASESYKPSNKTCEIVCLATPRWSKMLFYAVSVSFNNGEILARC